MPASCCSDGHPQSQSAKMAQHRAGGRRHTHTTGERSRRRARPDQQPAHRRSPQHRLAAPHQGRRPHPVPLHPVAPPLPLRPAQPRRRPPPRGRAGPIQPRPPHPRRPPGALPPALPHLVRLQVPPSVLRFAPTLRILSVTCNRHKIRFPSVAGGDVQFPHLKQLTFKGVIISEADLHGVLAGCHVLESLVLSELDGVSGVRISSSTLRSLGVSSGFGHEPEQLLEQVIVEDAPNLEKFFLDGAEYCLSICVVWAPKLEFLGSLPRGFTTAKLQAAFLQRTAAASLMSVMRTVKVLVLRMSPPSVDDLINFVTFFPCVEKLYVVLSRDGAFKRKRHHFPLGYIECFELHLRKIVLLNYYGSKKDVDLANFCLLNARVLERMEFATRLQNHPEKLEPKWIDDQVAMLQLDNMASHGIEIDFSGDSYNADAIHISHIHDLTADDPMDRSLCRCSTVDIL